MKIPGFFSDSCCAVKPLREASAATKPKRKIRIALAGNANVGKSALFNHLTGMNQHVANWPGKTVEMAEGVFRHANYEISVIDLPGIYSLSAFSKEEEVTREYILKEKPDVVINVINSCFLERNLFFTMQLLELGVPMAIALNQTDAAKDKGIEIDEKKLGNELRVPVIKTTALNGVGIWNLVDRCCEVAVEGQKPSGLVGKRKNRKSGVTPEAITKEKYGMAGRIAARVQKVQERSGGIVERIDALTTHWFFGYLIMLLVMGFVFYSIFTFGSVMSSWIGNAFNALRPSAGDATMNLIWEGLIGGFVAGITLVLPYALPFYLLITVLEDTGYLTRIAFLLDGIAHRIGFHGKAIIPIILGYGCNVPACFSCRIMEYERDRFITAFAVTMVPCTARTVVVLALVGAYLGPWWAIGLYVFNLIVIAVLAKIAFRILPGEPMGLIMEMPPYRMPSPKAVLKHTWWKIKSILSVVFPYYMIGGLAFAIAYAIGIFTPINNFLAPVTIGWLGLPALAATLLIFGIVRKEFIVVLPAVLYGSTDLSSIFSPAQMIVITIVALFYIPCFATIEAMRREYGWKRALGIAAFETVFAVLLGGVAFRVLSAVGIH